MTTNELSEALLKAMNARNEQEVLRLLECLSEKERQDLAPEMIATSKEGPRDLTVAGMWMIALAGTASFAELKRHVWSIYYPESIAKAIHARRPRWIGEFMLWQAADYTLIRTFMELGDCVKPTHDQYVLGFIEVGQWWLGVGDSKGDSRTRPDPIALEDVWRLFEVEGTTETSLSLRGGWMETLFDLSARGFLDRQRLLDACLDALSRDFRQFRARWFAQFHDFLKPTAEERRARVDRYLALLGSTIPPTVTMALGALLQIDETNALEFDKILPHLRPPLLAKTKATAKKTVQWIGVLISREPDHASEACDVLMTALMHEATEVQELALKVIEKHEAALTRAQRQELAQCDTISSTLKERVTMLAGSAPPSTTEVPQASTRIDRRQMSRLSTDRALTPITTIEGIIEAASRLLEIPVDPISTEETLNTELVLHAMVLTQHKCDAAFLKHTSSLRKQAQKKRKGWEMNNNFFADTVLAWLEMGQAWNPKNEADHDAHWKRYGEPYDTLWRRRFALAQDLMNDSVRLPMLATPTHKGGWLDPVVLVSRSKKWHEAQQMPDDLDQALALLRLAPEHCDEALVHARDLTGEWGAMLRHALGQNREAQDASSVLWKIAEHMRRTLAGLKEPGVTLHSALAPTFTLAQFNTDPVGSYFDAEKMRFWSMGEGFAPTICPSDIEPYLSANGKVLRSLHPPVYGEGWGDLAVSALADPFTPLGPVALRALGRGLGAQWMPTRNAATDALIAAISDGRLIPEELGATMCKLLPLIGPLQRWSKALAEVARVSTHHVEQVRIIVEHTLATNAPEVPTDIIKLLELLHEMVAQTGTPLKNEETRRFLKSLQCSGRSKKLVKALVA